MIYYVIQNPFVNLTPNSPSPGMYLSPRGKVIPFMLSKLAGQALKENETTLMLILS